jgi:hypothetical protein
MPSAKLVPPFTRADGAAVLFNEGPWRCLTEPGSRHAYDHVSLRAAAQV